MIAHKNSVFLLFPPQFIALATNTDWNTSASLSNIEFHIVSFDPFADFSTDATPAPAPAAAPVAPTVEQTTAQVQELDPFAQIGGSEEDSAPVQAAPAEFKVSVSPEPAPPQSGFASAHQFASPEHSVGETPERIPVTPIKGESKAAAPTSPRQTAEPSSSAPIAAAAPTQSAPELAGNLEKLAEGFLGEKWNMRWCGVKHNRFGYYNSKTDPRPKGFVFFDEADVGIPQNLATSNPLDYRFAFQISHERKNLDWFFRAPNQEVLQQWLSTITGDIKYYKALNSEPTILERVMSVSCVRDQVTAQGHERSFHFYTSKTSTGFYAVILCILTELLIRKIIDVVNSDEIALAPNATFTGIGLFDDTLDLIASKARLNPTKTIKIAELLPILLYGGGIVGSLGYSLGPDAFLREPVLRAIDHSTRRGTLERQGPKHWTVKNTQMEDQLMQQLNSLVDTPYEGTDVKDHAAVGICYTLLRAASKSPGADQFQHDILDRSKIFPNFPANHTMVNALDKMSKNIGAFEKKQAILFKTVFTAMTDFILGPVPK